MIREPILAVSAFALALATPAPPAPTAGDACPPGSTQETLTYTDEFGPELADWRNETLAVPKFVQQPNTTLIGVEVELCMSIMGAVVYQNMDDDPCTFTYEVGGMAVAMPADPGSPIAPFQISSMAQGGPIQLGPGEGGMDSFDSGVQCEPPQLFFDQDDLLAFIASPGNEEVVLDHSGMTTSASNGCGALFFDTEVFSTLTLRVTYTYCLGEENQPPECAIVPVGEITCQGDTTMVMLDGTGSSDPDGNRVSFLWSSDCPNATFDDPTSSTPILTIDTSGGCDLMCTVHLVVSDGELESACSTPIRIVPPPSSGDPGLDVKPTSCPNPVNTGSNGLVPVGLLGTLDFDVLQVDEATIRLSRADGVGGEVAPIRVQPSDVGTPFAGDPCDCHTLGGDGLLDLALKFRKQDLVAALLLEDEADGTYVEVRVTGQLLDGDSFTSDGDCIRVINH